MSHEPGYFDQKLAAVIGVEEAVIFNRLQWCVENPQMSGTIAHDGLKMIRNPIACTNPRKLNNSHGKQIDWLGNFIWATPGKLRRIFAKLEAIGLVVARKLRAHSWDQCKYYTINRDKLTELLKGAPLPICSKPTNRSGGNEYIDFATADKSYQDTFSDLPLQGFEREGAFEKNEIVFQEEKENQTEEFSQEIEDRSPEPVQEVICTPVNEEEDFWLNQKIEKLDRVSATVESAEANVEVAYGKAESVHSKVESVSDLELTEFNNRLIALGNCLGKRNPVAWAYTIVKNLGNKPCVYWEEFKAGVSLGTSEQREWEIAPGIPCQIAVQCLEQDFLGKPGETPQGAALKAARAIANPSFMKQIWETIKNRVLYQKRKWDEQRAMGIANPATLDTWMVPRPEAKREDVVIALTEMQASLPPALQPVHQVEQVLLPKPPVDEVLTKKMGYKPRPSRTAFLDF